MIGGGFQQWSDHQEYAYVHNDFRCHESCTADCHLAARLRDEVTAIPATTPGTPAPALEANYA